MNMIDDKEFVEFLKRHNVYLMFKSFPESLKKDIYNTFKKAQSELKKNNNNLKGVN